MKRILVIVACLIFMLSFTVLAHAYTRQEQCTCDDQNISLADAIKGELGDGFAADGDFIGIPDPMTTAGVVSSGDITLMQHTTPGLTTGSGEEGPGQNYTPPPPR